MPFWVLVVYGLATARLTGLITVDTITEPARQWVLRHLPLHAPGPFLAALITCAWCASVWVGFAVAPLALWRPTTTWVLYPALALAFAQFVGMSADLNRGEPTPDPQPDGAHAAAESRT
jgi:hypothetical protein